MMKRIMPTTYLLLALVLILFLHFIYPIDTILSGFWRLIGIAPLLLGILLNLAADQALKRYNTTVKPFQESQALIMEGVYGICRHPMYLGFVLILIGVVLLLGSVSPFSIVLLFTAWIEFVFIRTEEKMLEDRFQNTWVQYKSRVRKWV
jgi:protein-S-isoprenylcysteine O-methyltransferase Ste14